MKIDSLTDAIKKRRLCFCRHLSWMDNKRLTKKIFYKYNGLKSADKYGGRQGFQKGKLMKPVEWYCRKKEKDNLARIWNSRVAKENSAAVIPWSNGSKQRRTYSRIQSTKLVCVAVVTLVGRIEPVMYAFAARFIRTLVVKRRKRYFLYITCRKWHPLLKTCIHA